MGAPTQPTRTRGDTSVARGETSVARWDEFGPLQLDPILDASLAAFTELGYHGASVRNIANGAGVTVPTLYYHYENKQGLFVSLLHAAMEDLVWRTDQALAGADGDPLYRFVDLVDCTVQFMCHRQRVARLDGEARYLDAEARAAYAAPRRQIESQFLDVLRGGVQAGHFDVDHPVDVNRALLGAFQSIAVWYRRDGEHSPKEIAVRHVAFALDALRTERSMRDAAVLRCRQRANGD